MPERTLILGRAEENLKKWAMRPDKLDSIITGIPDFAGVDVVDTVEEYVDWYRDRIQQILMSITPEGYAIFYQLDRKLDGGILSKIWHAYDVARLNGRRPIWHKIIMRYAPGRVDFFRPGFAHFVCFSLTGRSGRAYPDVFPEERLSWKDGMPLTPVLAACEWLYDKGVRHIGDPFCGVGTVLAAANSVGMDATGVDFDADLIEKAQTLAVVNGKLNAYYPDKPRKVVLKNA